MGLCGPRSRIHGVREKVASIGVMAEAQILQQWLKNSKYLGAGDLPTKKATEKLL